MKYQILLLLIVAILNFASAKNSLINNLFSGSRVPTRNIQDRNYHKLPHMCELHDDCDGELPFSEFGGDVVPLK